MTPLDHAAVLRCTCSHAETRPAVSDLWGLRGEAYSEAGPLRDWSRAGYGAGDRPIPAPDPSSNLMLDWNATGDGIADDTQVALPFLCRVPPFTKCAKTTAFVAQSKML